MSVNEIDWLSLRESQDRIARSGELAEIFVSAVQPNDLIVDIACGTGANQRYLQPLLGRSQRWLGIDQDDDALKAMRDSGSPSGTRRLDLAASLQDIPTCPGVAMTASAFLDLTSSQWIAEFAAHVFHSPLLIAMTASGLPKWEPSHRDDSQISECLRRHKISDHGFGPSLATEASDHLARELSRRQCDVTIRPSDWDLGSESGDVIRVLIDGVARRVQSMTNSIDPTSWAECRHQQNRKGGLRVVVPHTDLLSIPPRSIESTIPKNG